MRKQLTRNRDRVSIAWGFKQPLHTVIAGSLCCIVLISGCTTTTSRQSGFTPVKPTLAADPETPVPTRSVTDLLRDAEQAFVAANRAQENGDAESAMRHYNVMLESLLEADLDPSVYYAVRQEFASILSVTSNQSGSSGHHQPVAEVEEQFVAADDNGIHIPFPIPERVLVEIDQIQNVYPKSFQKGLNKSYRYLPYIQSELKKQGLPEELAYVAMIESMFTPKIVSRAGAGGMWQFMRSTGQRFELRIDQYVDERYNWQSATQAAMTYLKNLYDYFEGDWALALSAYNMGENGLERAIAANGGERNFWQLIETPPAAHRIPRETKKYFPKFLATLIVARNPERYGFVLEPEPAENSVRLAVKGCYALEDLDESLGYSRGTLARLNPDLLNEMTPPVGSYSIAVPVKDKDRLLASLKVVPTLKYGTGTHIVKPGQTISLIASRYGVSQRELMRLNGIKSPKRLQINQKLRLPGFQSGLGGGGLADTSGGAYIVRQGDSLSTIAKRHKTSVTRLQQWNRMGRSTRLRAGQRLHISDPSRLPRPTTGEKFHMVVAGDYPAKVARQYRISLEELYQWNSLKKNDMIRVGDRLVVSKEAPKITASTISSTGSTKISHTVASGESASVIARKYGVKTSDFLKWNNLTPKSILRVGASCTVYTDKAPDRRVAANTQLAKASTGFGKEAITHVVAKGQNPTTIARRYGVRVSDLFKWNDWPNKHVLQIGDRVLIHP